jgi:hypothetical protein
MASTTDKLIDLFAAMVKDHGVPIRKEDNALRLRLFEKKLPKRLPQSFESFLSRYSFPGFDVLESRSLLGIPKRIRISTRQQPRRAAYLSCLCHRATYR